MENPFNHRTEHRQIAVPPAALWILYRRKISSRQSGNRTFKVCDESRVFSSVSTSNAGSGTMVEFTGRNER
ncbi:MAG: hypothetical protein R3B91_13320 [Planctomycetaceae bacterium]